MVAKTVPAMTARGLNRSRRATAGSYSVALRSRECRAVDAGVSVIVFNPVGPGEHWNPGTPDTIPGQVCRSLTGSMSCAIALGP